MNETNAKKNKRLCIVFLIVGLLFLLIGFYNLYNYNIYYKKGYKIDARIENILEYPDSNDEQFETELEYYKSLLQEYKDKGVIKENTNVAIIIIFDYNGQSYEKELGYYSSDLHIGQLVTIYLKNNNPNDFLYEGKSKFAIYAALIVGITLSIISCAILLILTHNSKVQLNLKSNGLQLKAKVLYCDENEKIEKFNRHPYILTCVYINEETKEELVFTSDSTFLTNSVDNYIDKYVNVYVDKENNKNYYVDVDNFFDK